MGTYFNTDLRSVQFVDNDNGWIVGNDRFSGQGRFMKTTNGGNEWKTQLIPETDVLNSVHFIDLNTGWAVGGDGTVNEVASGLIRKKSALGILPLGSGNGIARSLNIPLEFETTIDLLLSPPILTIDVGKLNGKNFIGIAGTGYDALVGKKFQTFGIRGPLPYFFISVKEFISYRYQNYSITIDNEPLQIKALMVTFANTREYGNGAVIAPNADPADGFLDICFMKPLTLPGAIAVAPMLFNNKIDTHPGFVSKKCRSVTVRAGGEDMFVHRDGEPDESTRALEVGIEEKALRVCTPLGAKI